MVLDMFLFINQNQNQSQYSFIVPQTGKCVCQSSHGQNITKNNNNSKK